MGAKDIRQSKKHTCLNCKKIFFPFYSAVGIYCSKKCQGLHKINKKNPAWKGKKVSYRGIHYWVVQRLGKPLKCTLCNKEGKGKKDAKKFHWANLSRKYKRNLNDWIRLCSMCHGIYDKGHRKKLKV